MYKLEILVCQQCDGRGQNVFLKFWSLIFYVAGHEYSKALHNVIYRKLLLFQSLGIKGQNHFKWSLCLLLKVFSLDFFKDFLYEGRRMWILKSTACWFLSKNIVCPKLGLIWPKLGLIWPKQPKNDPSNLLICLI